MKKLPGSDPGSTSQTEQGRKQFDLSSVPEEGYSIFVTFTYIVPDVVGTMGMSSASVGIDHGIWNWGASSRIMVFLEGER